MDFLNMMQNARDMMGKMKGLQEELRTKTVEAESGGGMVRVRMNGAGELLGMEIEPAVADPRDTEMLADLITAAVNAARKKTNDLRVETIQELGGGLDLSSLGINLDDMM